MLAPMTIEAPVFRIRRHKLLGRETVLAIVDIERVNLAVD